MLPTMRGAAPVQERLNYFQETWELNEEQCPCDLHFLEYLQANAVEGKTIFHFGSGAHHVVGRKNAELARPNHVLAITASPGEHQRYVELIIEHPRIAVSYKVLFADIYTLSPQMLPRFDVVTLFHLGEYYSPERSGYAPLNDATLLDLFIERLQPGGRICFYDRSWLFERARPVIQAAVAEGKLAFTGSFRTLLLYAAPARP